MDRNQDTEKKLTSEHHKNSKNLTDLYLKTSHVIQTSNLCHAAWLQICNLFKENKKSLKKPQPHFKSVQSISHSFI